MDGGRGVAGADLGIHRREGTRDGVLVGQAEGDAAGLGLVQDVRRLDLEGNGKPRRAAAATASLAVRARWLGAAAMP